MRVLLLVSALALAAAFSPGVAPARSPSLVEMNTKYTTTAGLAKKKGKTGSSTLLKGYTVGSRAPNVARSSGTKAGSRGYNAAGYNPTVYGAGQRNTSVKGKKAGGGSSGGIVVFLVAAAGIVASLTL